MWLSSRKNVSECIGLSICRPSCICTKGTIIYFTDHSHHRLPSSLRTDSTDFTTGLFLLTVSVFFGFSFFIILFCSVPCGRLSWLLVSFWAHVDIANRIVSYRTEQYDYWHSDG